jgi:poly(A) polymerase
MPKLYKVGGCVRDKILGIESNDIDFTFVLDDLNESVEEGFAFMEKWMTDRKFEIFLSTPAMFTIRARFPKDNINAGLIADFVMARKETGYIEGTRKPILALGNLEDDLIRRDFTLNAIAEAEDGTLIDLYNGIEDLNDRILKTPLPAAQTMMDDPLRILRALRFSITKGFVIHSDIWRAMEQGPILNKLEKTVSKERIREEVMKMMKHNTVMTMKTFMHIERSIPGFLNLVFGNDMWLKPTLEKR